MLLTIGLIGYVLLQFAIGVWVSRRIASDTDYILAGRTLGPTLVAFSVFATWFGAEAIVATTSEVYTKGLAGALVDPFAYGLAVVMSGLVLAALLWRCGLTTFADLFERRYSPVVAKLVVIILLPGSLFWAAAQIRAFGQVLGASSGLDVRLAIAIAAVLVGAYTTIGGLLADSVTDLLQGLVVIIGLIVLSVVIAGVTGGLGAVLAATPATKLQLLGGEEGALDKLERVVIAVCGSLVAIELISRYLGSRSAEVARVGTMAGGVLYLTMGLLPVFLGLAAATLATSDPGLERQLGASEQIVATLARYYMPTIGYVIFAGAIVSAILSNVHATLHAPAAQVSNNIVVRWLPRLDAGGRLWAARLTVLVLSAIAFALALTSDRIKDLVETASAFGSAGVLVTTVFALFTRIGGPLSAIAAVSCGMAVWGIGGAVLEWRAPYIIALASSTLAYLAAAWWEHGAYAAAARRQRP